MGAAKRIGEYIEKQNISMNAFDKSVGASNGYIGKLIKKDGSIGSNVIEKIALIYTELNLCWLFTGEGEMIKKCDGTTADFNDSIFFEKKLKEKDDKIIELATKIGRLENQIEVLKKDKQNTTYRLASEP
jgi:hypothetical protein